MERKICGSESPATMLEELEFTLLIPSKMSSLQEEKLSHTE